MLLLTWGAFSLSSLCFRCLLCNALTRSFAVACQPVRVMIARQSTEQCPSRPESPEEEREPPQNFGVAKRSVSHGSVPERNDDLPMAAPGRVSLPGGGVRECVTTAVRSSADARRCA